MEKDIVIKVTEHEWLRLFERYSRGEDLEGYEQEIHRAYPTTQMMPITQPKEQ